MFNAQYGIDAPPVIRNLALITALAYVLAGLNYGIMRAYHPNLAIIFSGLFLIFGSIQLVMLLWMLYSSLAGKMRMRDKLIADLQLSGNEHVLDIGCGRGLLLIGAAKQLTQGGRAVGLDLWSKADLSSNSEQRTLARIQKEQVADRTTLESGDMRELPFADNTFDVIVSSMAIHNVSVPAERAKTIYEIDRVLKPGGKIALLDFQFTDEYRRTLETLGWTSLSLSQRYWFMFPPVHMVTGKKPVVS
jgi:ubiquinone/menaquinone biosynthesis C-methylase UbiE